MTNLLAENNIDSMPLEIELWLGNKRLKSDSIEEGEEINYTVPGEKFTEGLNELDLHVEGDKLKSTQVMRKVPRFSEKGIVKPGVGDGEDLMPHVSSKHDECQDDILELYLNGYKKATRENHPKVGAEFKLWAEGQRKIYGDMLYEVDIFTYPNLRYNYKLQKICPDSESIDIIEEWNSEDNFINLGITYPESPQVLPNKLNWEPTGEITGEELELDYRVYIEVYTTPIDIDETPEKTVTLTPEVDYEILEDEKIISRSNDINFKMDDSKSVEGHFGAAKDISVNFVDKDLVKVYQPEGDKEILTVNLSDTEKILMEDLMTEEELAQEVDDYIAEIGNVVIEVVEIKTDHNVDDITFHPGQQFTYEGNQNITIKAEHSDYEITGCPNPAIRIVDNSPYNDYSFIDADITFENGEKIAHKPQDILGYNDFKFNSNDYKYNEIDKFDSTVGENSSEEIKLPTMEEIEGINEDVVRNVTAEIRAPLRTGDIVPGDLYPKEGAEKEEVPKLRYLNETVHLKDIQHQSINIIYDKVIGEAKCFETESNKVIGEVECFRTDMPHYPIVVFAYDLKEGEVDLEWDYDNIRPDKADDNMTMTHNINTFTDIPTNDKLLITPVDPEESSNDYAIQYMDFTSASVYVNTLMFFSTINGMGQDNKKDNFIIDYEVLPTEKDDSIYSAKYIPILLGPQDKRVALPIPTDAHIDDVTVFAKLTKARVKKTGVEVTDKTDFKISNIFSEYEDKDNHLWSNTMWDIVDGEIVAKKVIMKPAKDKDISVYFTDEDIDKGKIIISSDYSISEDYQTYWQSDEPAIIKLKNICQGDIKITPDNLEKLFTSLNIQHYWDIPENVYGPYTISIDSTNNFVNNEVNYSMIPPDVEGGRLQ